MRTFYRKAIPSRIIYGTLQKFAHENGNPAQPAPQSHAHAYKLANGRTDKETNWQADRTTDRLTDNRTLNIHDVHATATAVLVSGLSPNMVAIFVRL